MALYLCSCCLWLLAHLSLWINKLHDHRTLCSVGAITQRSDCRSEGNTSTTRTELAASDLKCRLSLWLCYTQLRTSPGLNGDVMEWGAQQSSDISVNLKWFRLKRLDFSHGLDVCCLVVLVVWLSWLSGLSLVCCTALQTKCPLEGQ